MSGFQESPRLRRLQQTTAFHCTGAVCWKPAPRCFHQVSEHCERDLFQRRAAETCPVSTVWFRGAERTASVAISTLCFTSPCHQTLKKPSLRVVTLVTQCFFFLFSFCFLIFSPSLLYSSRLFLLRREWVRSGAPWLDEPLKKVLWGVELGLSREQHLACHGSACPAQGDVCGLRGWLFAW